MREGKPTPGRWPGDAVLGGKGMAGLPTARGTRPRGRKHAGGMKEPAAPVRPCWARLRRAPRPVPTLLCAGLGLRGLSVDLLSRPPGWLGGNPWGKGAGQRVSASRGRSPQGRGEQGTTRAGVMDAH